MCDTDDVRLRPTMPDQPVFRLRFDVRAADRVFERRLRPIAIEARTLCVEQQAEQEEGDAESGHVLIKGVETPGSAGFSTTPTPRLIATRQTEGPALALSRGLDRDRAVDESGNQVSVFGRLGARPFTRAEMDRLFMRNGQLYAVSSEPPGKPLRFVRPERPVAGPEGGPVVQPLAPTTERLLPGRR